GEATALCPSGMRAFGGGAGAFGADAPAHQIQVTTAVGPDGLTPPQGGSPALGWRVSIYDYGSSSAAFGVYALCSQNSDALRAPGVDWASGSGHATPVVVTQSCNHSSDVLGLVTGGGITNLTGSTSPPPAYITSSGPVGTGTWEAGEFQFVN